MFGLRLFSRTSDRRRFNLASFHSPHSLTWSWILSFATGGVVVKPYASVRREYGTGKVYGAGAGLGGLIGFSAHRNNNGWQWTASLLFMHLAWSRQTAMYFRDMHGRASLERDRLERENSRLRSEVAAVHHAAPQAELRTIPNHLH